jgi:hypothetical protein
VLAAHGTGEERETNFFTLGFSNLCSKCGAQMVNNYCAVFVGREPRFSE